MKYIRSMDLMEVPREPKTKMEKVMKDLMWSDPVEESELRDESATYSATLEKHGYTIDDILAAGWIGSRRGAGILFSHVVTGQFLSLHGYEYMVRSHQMVPQGYQSHHNGTLYTLFSASRYCGNNVSIRSIERFFIFDCFHGKGALDFLLSFFYLDMGAYMIIEPSTISKPQFKSYFAQSFPGIHDYDPPASATAAPIQNPIITHVPASQVGAGATPQPAVPPADAPPKPTSSTPPRKGSLSTSGAGGGDSLDSLIKDTLERLGEKIFNKRHKLLIEFSKQDQSNTGAIPIDIWEIVMRKVTKLNVPWRALWPHMRPQTVSAIVRSIP
jgi:diadenosine tetraphosphatase ApaH/serine/threonine PP2A family protein phosphatase